MSYSVMNDETFILRSPGEEQRKILDQYRLMEIFRDIYGNYMLDRCPEGAARDAIAAVKRFKGVDEVDIGRWKDLIIDLMYSERILGFKPWEYFSYGFEDKSIAGRLEFIPQRNILTYYGKILNTNREDFLKLHNKYLTYQMLTPYFKRDMCILQGDEQKEEFFEFCRRHPRFIIKPAGGGVGKRVEIVDREDYKNLEELIAALRAKKKPSSSIVCEELIVGEDSMRAIHPQSVNSVRFFTYVKTSGEPRFVCAWLKAGQGDAIVDNGTAGGVVAAIDIETGIVYTDAADEGSHVFPVHPDTGFVFKGFQIPRWEELKGMMLELAPAFPGTPLIGWDVALSKDRGWQVIEANSNGMINIIQIATKTGCRKQVEAAIEWDKHRVKLRRETW